MFREKTDNYEQEIRQNPTENDQKGRGSDVFLKMEVKGAWNIREKSSKPR